ncbi:MAG: hypothetical protein HN742_13495 [Lentisphaerae bacterium]|jgi:hypothetical protein|nr:hypothetical protein [Lentisphaerota bacterium]MBT4818938.1 hypothetical protein [Lentisphaerota bacterium]MBT5608228.1 hypothetical protein [Lentisphaerota bacterium]MBT7058883.1 hypothetical protein [Lentisphaerota bacterium]MBT7842886.1 hypothetical protein [Lentisphaerota bacterium]
MSPTPVVLNAQPNILIGSSTVTTRRLSIFLVVSVIIVSSAAPTDLRCEWQTSPAVVTDPCPEFYWETVSQSACRVLVSQDADFATTLWDSGRREQALAIVEYAGPTLKDDTVYYWQVHVWNATGRLQSTAPIQTFRLATGPLPRHLPTIRTFMNFGGNADFARDWLDLSFRKQVKSARDDILVVHYGLVCTLVVPHPSTGKPLSGKAKSLADFCVREGLTKAGILEDMFCHFAEDTKVNLHVGRESASCPRETRICPGWDPRNDRNGDASLDDAEFANLVNPKATARRPQQSRIPIYYWGPPRDDFVMNVGHPAYQTFMATVHAPELCEGWDGIYFDTVPPDVAGQGQAAAVLEYPRKGKEADRWLRDLQVLFAQVKIALPDKMITGNGWEATPMVLDGRQSEGWQALSRNLSSWETAMEEATAFENRGKVQLIQYNPIWDAELAEFGPKLPVSADRDKIFGLATYLLAHGDYSYFGFGRHPYSGVTKLWFKAMHVDLGNPTAPYELFARIDAAADPTAENMLRNGGFEEADANNHAVGWGVEEPVEIDYTVRHMGKSSIKIHSESSAINNFHNWQYVTLKPHTTYTLIAWARTDRVVGKTGAQIYPYEFEGATTQFLTWRGTRDWQEKRQVFTTGDDAEGRVSFRMYGATGTVWFDDIRIVEGAANEQRVFGRRFEKGMVLVKPFVGGSFGDDTATTHELPTPLRPIDVHGTPGAPVKAVSLRNAEAVILVR